jgi:hypothetical protein
MKKVVQKKIAKFNYEILFGCFNNFIIFCFKVGTYNQAVPISVNYISGLENL